MDGFMFTSLSLNLCIQNDSYASKLTFFLLIWTFLCLVHVSCYPENISLSQRTIFFFHVSLSVLSIVPLQLFPIGQHKQDHQITNINSTFAHWPNFKIQIQIFNFILTHSCYFYEESKTILFHFSATIPNCEQKLPVKSMISSLG